MATARVRLRVAQPKVTRFGVTQSKLTQAVPFVERRAGAANSRAAFRLLSAERSDEIFPILLEEILTLGFARAMVSNLDFAETFLEGAGIPVPAQMQGRSLAPLLRAPRMRGSLLLCHLARCVPTAEARLLRLIGRSAFPRPPTHYVQVASDRAAKDALLQLIGGLLEPVAPQAVGDHAGVPARDDPPRAVQQDDRRDRGRPAGGRRSAGGGRW